MFGLQHLPEITLEIPEFAENVREMDDEQITKNASRKLSVSFRQLGIRVQPSSPKLYWKRMEQSMVSVRDLEEDLSLDLPMITAHRENETD
jgi:hypothetical protein